MTNLDNVISLITSTDGSIRGKLEMIRWMRYLSISNIFGVGGAASLLVLFYYALEQPRGLREWSFFAVAVVVAGVLHGTIFGYFQYRVLPHRELRISLFEWLTATIAACAVGWFLLIAPFLFIGNPEPTYALPSVIQNFPVDDFILIAMAAGLSFGTVIGTAQWTLLKRRCDLPQMWIAANAFGWALGMPFIYLTATFPDFGTPKFIIVILCSFGGELSGNVVSLITFFALGKMKPK